MQDGLGIPDRTVFKNLPKGENQVWTLSLQKHYAEKAGIHYDLRLSPTSSGQSAYSWVVKNGLPTPGNKALAIEQPTHSFEYMQFSGEIKEGYGKGKVELVMYDKVDVLDIKPNKLTFNIYKGNTVQRYMLLRTGGKNWLLYNFTTTIANKLVPTTKPHYKEIKFGEVHTSDSNQVFAPKLDGSHNIIVIRPGKRIDTYSYRISKKGDERIDHSFKTDLYKVRGPKHMGTTVVRGELFVPGQESTTVGGLLNSNTLKSRREQLENNTPLQLRIFDVEKFQGKDVSTQPYREKFNILRKIQQFIPQLRLTELAYSVGDKLKLIDRIKSGKHPETDEGIVVYDLDSPIPTKAKIKHDFDMLITGVFGATKGSKYEGKAVGGFVGYPEGNKNVTLRVGSGLNDALRIDAYNNPEKFIGQWAKIESPKKLKTGKYRQPIFKEIRYEKFN